MFPKALILYLGTSIRRKAQRLSLLLYLPANSSLPECDCSFLFMFHQTAEMVLREKLTKKIIFYCDYEALKVFRIYRCHPVHTAGSSRYNLYYYYYYYIASTIGSTPRSVKGTQA
jgi:hypothetical protein